MDERKVEKLVADSPLAQRELEELYKWIDQIPLSRPKSNIARDFSDGVLMSEVVYNFFPNLIDCHNYSSASGQQGKLSNWSTLNNKCFKKMGFKCSQTDLEAVCASKKGKIEVLLYNIQLQFLRYKEACERRRKGADNRNNKKKPVDNYSPKNFSPPSKPKAVAGRRANGGGNGGNKPKDYSPSNNSKSAKSHSEKDKIIAELTDTVQLQSKKMEKLEALLSLKNKKLQALEQKVCAMNGY